VHPTGAARGELPSGLRRTVLRVDHFSASPFSDESFVVEGRRCRMIGGVLPESRPL